MKKVSLLVLLLSTFLIVSCEKDDFCTENPVTPNLILRFYDAENPTALKKVDSLYVWAKEKDSIIINQNTGSIAIPLNTLSNNTIYNLSKGILLSNQFTITYNTEEEFVSRSCGFRVIFNNVAITNNSTTNTWIQSFTPETLTTINHQSVAHVKVYH
ncbi:DUF6452 family protein [Tenacibaculum maritimum]|uniref:DUF6452 family protein n=1 Tax=Tenacibaculum maritimum TaxID=107401 RepID=UPI0012E4B85F|nr:DUF6452 family protein [Tenacibaculum maritimum]MCD9582334.1 DUF6452 family protein [Tenacibaculum maritimum]MCD9636707.1 DUF6452 family protein [Tenacibaculum maritimum]CAA0197445.1 Probable lipoprotein precursor [Tenacibaculum maritimum]CAA0220035.1 Probable lipoprotein precursor [Tenacibaculum maritimum]